MLKFKLIVLFFFPLFLSLSKCEKKDEIERIVWSESKKLEWRDFKGKPDKNDSVFKAMTYVLIGIEYKETEQYIIFQIPCTFNKTFSWSKSKSKKLSSKWLLEHEQLHFDIAELMARKIRKEFSEYYSYNLKDTYLELQKVYDHYFKTELLSMNTCYDSETDHGTIRSKQKLWEDKITKELNKLRKYANTEVMVRRY